MEKSDELGPLGHERLQVLLALSTDECERTISVTI
jgi:hypothetical protein